MDKIRDFVQSGDDNSGGKDDRKQGYQQQQYPGGNIPQGGGYGAGFGGPDDDDDDLRGAGEEAARRAGDSGSSDLFNGILGTLGQKKTQIANEDIDEQHAVKSHRKFFGDEDDDDEADERGMGSAAAMQALKMFAGGGSSESTHSAENTQSQSQGQGAFVAMAMAEASKLFDQKSSQGKVSPSSSKESAVMQAGELALKMYLKSQGGNQQSSGSSGSTAGLMSLASKYL